MDPCLMYVVHAQERSWQAFIDERFQHLARELIQMERQSQNVFFIMCQWFIESNFNGLCAMLCHAIPFACVFVGFFMLLFIIHILDISQLPLYNRPNTNRCSLKCLTKVEKMTILFWFLASLDPNSMRLLCFAVRNQANQNPLQRTTTPAAATSTSTITTMTTIKLYSRIHLHIHIHMCIIWIKLYTAK